MGSESFACPGPVVGEHFGLAGFNRVQGLGGHSAWQDLLLGHRCGHAVNEARVHANHQGPLSALNANV
jgi:hypothetical protein